MEWLTLTKNIQHAFKTGLMKKLLKPVYLNGKKFESMAEASRWLGRNKGYVSNTLKSNRDTVSDKNGRKYKVTA